MPNLHCAAVGCTADSRKLKLLGKYPWMDGVTFTKFPTSLSQRRIWYNLLRRGGPNDRMTVENIGKWQRVCSQHFVDGRPTPQHPHPTLFDYNNFKVSKTPRTPTARTPTGKGFIKSPVNTTPVRSGPVNRRPYRLVLTKVASDGNGNLGPEIGANVEVGQGAAQPSTVPSYSNTIGQWLVTALSIEGREPVS